MKARHQPDLFSTPPARETTPKYAREYAPAPFDFARDGDAACCVPRPDTPIPAWLLIAGLDEAA